MENFALVVSILSGLLTICSVLGILWKAFGWFNGLKEGQNRNAEDIKMLKEQIDARKKEDMLLAEGVSACLDGLKQLGANHCVCDAKTRLDEYINRKAHE